MLEQFLLTGPACPLVFANCHGDVSRGNPAFEFSEADDSSSSNEGSVQSIGMGRSAGIFSTLVVRSFRDRLKGLRDATGFQFLAKNRRTHRPGGEPVLELRSVTVETLTESREHLGLHKFSWKPDYPGDCVIE